MSETKFFKLGKVYPSEKFSDQEKLDHKKIINKFLSEAKKQSKGEYCLYCKKEVSSFCNSHSIPAFCLRNIAIDGKVLSNNNLVEIPIIDFEKGVKSAGTFQLICKECDGVIFQEYENPENYKHKPTMKMLAQIAMKNSLRNIGKRKNEIELTEIMKEKIIGISELDFFTQQLEVQKLDLKEYEESYNRAKKVSEKNFDNEYYLFCYEKLNYVVPIAFQGAVALALDFDNNIINDFFCKDPNYKILNMHICVFPLKETTVVMMFIDSNDQKRYRSFYKKFNKLSLNEKLSVINYIIFLYSEDLFLSKKISSEILQNESLRNAAQTTPIAITQNPLCNPLKAASESYDLNNHKNTINILDEKYKIR